MISVLTAEIVLYLLVKIARGGEECRGAKDEGGARARACTNTTYNYDSLRSPLPLSRLADFNYWMPLYGVLGTIWSFFVRIVVIVLVQWTACAQLRHLLECGGAYWSFTVLVGLSTGIASSLAVSDGNFEVTLACCSDLAVCYVLFLAFIERDYVWTFFDMRRIQVFGRQFQIGD